MTNQPPDPPKIESFEGVRERGWVSLRAFCEFADITYQTGVRWCRLEMIKFTQVGGTKRIYEEEIARFIRHGTLTPNPHKLAQEKAKRQEYKTNAAYQRHLDRTR